jgi:predicted nucleotidyltransferase
VYAGRTTLGRILHDHGASDGWVFGSVARGEDRQAPTFDLLIEMPDADYIGLGERAA